MLPSKLMKGIYFITVYLFVAVVLMCLMRLFSLSLFYTDFNIAVI
jgi:hypothetical protein